MTTDFRGLILVHERLLLAGICLVLLLVVLRVWRMKTISTAKLGAAA